MSIFELQQDINEHGPVIKVIGVGGAGGNAITHMVDSGLTGVTFIAANTDAQDLREAKADIRIQLGEALTRGLGAGANPEIGRQAAEETKDHIKAELNGADMVFIAAGMGGGTGTGAAPIVAEIAKELGILTVAVVSRPFSMEGKKRDQAANQGLKQLAQQVDSLITIPNDRLMSVLGKGVSLYDAFSAANNVLFNAVQGITDSIIKPGMINLDFNDVKTVMKQQGLAMMGVGLSSGDNAAREAIQQAISSPLLEEVSLKGAKGLLVNISGGPKLSIGDLHEIGAIISDYANEETTVVFGAVIDEEMGDDIRVTLVATGLGEYQAPIERGSIADQLLGRTVKPAAVASPVEPVVREQPKASPSSQSSGYLDIPAFLRKNS
ncbi:cell division protein FtsZ [Ignatzschineria cameli]|uniref:Cell division protein FtsZ n=1 Tax=Ignatzschineria cameli TaxID=2182793 RepID=A0A2U2ASH2_9GAMM|nr:cell division protein FtsZ [Ignatzschineria cameli]PWD86530.1 cell division protein FtsZ [Ignatzschineria cameli]PWD87117.1 cell division protein FtsZ [Ignatzschineria cameli]PWD92090.1 cell division protein FtsZ [Ignatzschineria cameli]PWD93325.1 cell division protein FtsZ [Ignatzschineria cameli]PWD94067.1 cell division protein FtsZ [Ignatzschineria cameli]